MKFQKLSMYNYISVFQENLSKNVNKTILSIIVFLLLTVSNYQESNVEILLLLNFHDFWKVLSNLDFYKSSLLIIKL